VDSPTNYGTNTGAGGEVRGNYCTWNLEVQASSGAITYSNGNMDATNTIASSDSGCAGTILFSSGKYYFESLINVIASGSNVAVGINNSSEVATDFATIRYDGIYRQDGGIRNLTGTTQTSGASYIAGDVIGVAIDCNVGSVQFYKNGVSQGSTPSFTFTPGTSVVVRGRLANGGSAGSSISINCGQRPFAYPAPSGFNSLCTANLPTPTVVKPSTVMDVVLYTGTGSALTPTSSLGFSPDLVWLKSRSATASNALYDSVRGATRDLVSDSTAAETTQAQGLTSFDSNGFSIGTLAKINTNAATYVGWCWDSGTSTASNTDGSITSSVRANPTAGFSVISYTGNGSSGATIGHGLGVTPQLVIVKNRDSVADWPVYHVNGGSTYLLLNTTAARTAGNPLAPGSTTITLGGSGSVGLVNESGQKCICYAFSSVAGYSQAFSYSGNGLTPYGPMFYLGFRPKLLLIKRSIGGVASWFLWDSMRNPDNVVGESLASNSNNPSTTTADLDIMSYGFKIRSNNSYINASASTYVGFAWAESPFNYALAR
jgi:hypothetical protein